MKKSLGTHNGVFHADEVTACALLHLYGLIDLDKVRRTRNPEVLAQCEYVCDVGGTYDPERKLFDHHQVEYQGGMSSAGMVLLYLCDQGAIDQLTYDYLNRSLVHGIDLNDNGQEPAIHGYCSFSNVVQNFTPICYSTGPEELDAAFFEAVNFVLGHLKRLLARFEYIQSCRDKVAKAMDEGTNFLMFEEAIPWVEIFFEMSGEKHPALFIVMPAGDHWKLRGIPPNYDDRMSVRHPLPETWAGLHDEELQKASKIPGAIFCHKGRFISVWQTKDDAMQALDKALKSK